MLLIFYDQNLGYNTKLPFCPLIQRHLQDLNLSGCNLKSIPEQIYRIELIEKLIMSNNKIDALGENLAKLQCLKVLELSNNNIETIPMTVKSLVALEVFNLSSNKLKSVLALPPAVSFVDLSGNYHLSQLPDLRAIGTLKRLILKHCAFTKTPLLPRDILWIDVEGNPMSTEEDENLSMLDEKSMINCQKGEQKKSTTDTISNVGVAEMQGVRLSMVRTKFYSVSTC